MLNAIRNRLLPGVVLATMLAATASLVAAEDIDPQNDNSQFAWGENVGWINAEPSGSGGPGVDVAFNELTGHMYGENIGWINLNCKNNNTCGTVQYGVTNDGTGKLGGYAWGENVGWISFCDEDPVPGPCKTAGSDYRVVIDPVTGIFSGFAWGENIGWISFSDTSPVAYKVQMTDNDTVPGGSDNCPFDANQNQVNNDAAGGSFGGTMAWISDGTGQEGSSTGGDVCDENDDNNGCLDDREAILIPARTPANPWDFADMWVPALPAVGPATGGRNGAVALADALAVLTWVGRVNSGPPGSDGRDYDADVNANGVDDGAEYDRTPGVGPGLSSPPNGALSLQDALVVIDQVGDAC